EAAQGWHETIGRVTIDLDIHLPVTDALSVVASSPRPAFDDALMRRYIPNAQDNICNEPGWLFQFYNGPEDNRASYVITAGMTGSAFYGEAKPDTAFKNGMTFDLLEQRLDTELKYLTGQGLNGQDWLLTYEAAFYTDVDSLHITATPRVSGLPVFHRGAMLCMQTWDRDYCYFWLDLLEVGSTVIADMPLSSLEPVKDALRQKLAAEEIQDVREVSLWYVPFCAEPETFQLIPVWRVLAKAGMHGRDEAVAGFWFDVQRGEQIRLTRRDQGYILVQPPLTWADIR
ncbi:MAG: hypothetical protein ACI4MK_03715, partial [Aristaeellaceae bacterium]